MAVGFNPHESPAAGGSSVLYFGSSHHRSRGVAGPARLELTWAGHAPEIIGEHQAGGKV